MVRWTEAKTQSIPGQTRREWRPRADPAAEKINQQLFILYVGGKYRPAPPTSCGNWRRGQYLSPTRCSRGRIPETHDLSLGMPGMHGTAYASHAQHFATIAIGARFDDRVTGDASARPGAGSSHDIDRVRSTRPLDADRDRRRCEDGAGGARAL